MMRKVQEGDVCFCFTPDGPRGPIYEVHHGIVKLASQSGLPIVPVCIEYESCWRLNKTWDRYAIPKPCSNVNILWKSACSFLRTRRMNRWRIMPVFWPGCLARGFRTSRLLTNHYYANHRWKQVASQVLEEVERDIARLREQGITPGLAVVLVGEDPASQVYVNSKVKKCAELGMNSRKIVLPSDASQEELLRIVRELNVDPAVHGILVQSPPPPHIDEAAVVLEIDPAKDVDGFHPENVAKLVLEDETGFVPCTPLGCMRLLKAPALKRRERMPWSLAAA